MDVSHVGAFDSLLMGQIASRETAPPDGERMRRVKARAAATLKVATVDGVFSGLLLALWWLLGLASLWPALLYTGAACGINLLNHVLVASGRTARLRDPSLMLPNVLAYAVLLLGCALAFPPIGFHFLCGLFLVFAYGLFGLTVAGFVWLWGVTMAGLALVLHSAGSQLTVPLQTSGGTAMVWLVLACVMGRCVMLSLNMRALQRRVHQQSKDLAASLRQVDELASRDMLTGVYNRRSLMFQAQQALAGAERSGVAFAIAILDVDHFKHINDRFGHPTGDVVLQLFAELVLAETRVADRFGRFGGEEFMVILHATDHLGLLAPLERIHQAITLRDWQATVPGVEVTASMGATVWARGDSLEQMIKRADDALYEAKCAGRNRIVVAPGRLREAALATAAMPA
jgi:diguanylate cyclase (GGDEF)-like protein